jgi:hypothetical protein
MGTVTTLYPDGYRDPEWDGTVEDFAAKVLPARAAAITQGLNERFADVLPEGCRFEWVSVPGPVPPPEVTLWPVSGSDDRRDMRGNL